MTWKIPIVSVLKMGLAAWLRPMPLPMSPICVCDVCIEVFTAQLTPILFPTSASLTRQSTTWDSKEKEAIASTRSSQRKRLQRRTETDRQTETVCVYV